MATVKKKETILITGANGFVGSKLCEHFIKKGYKVRGLVRKTSDLSFLKPLMKKLKLYYGDIRNKDSIRAAFKNTDIVIHPAGYTNDWGKMKIFYDINVIGTKNIAELCLEYSIKHLVHFSTINVYGFNDWIKADENTEIKPTKYPYSITKLEGERTISHFIKVFNLPATIIQPGQIYGPNDRTMSYKIIEALVKKQFAVCSNGKYLMSTLYIDNLMQAVELIIKKKNKSVGKKYIVTDDLQVTWREFTEYFCKILKVPFPWINLPGSIGRCFAYILEPMFKLLNTKNAPLITHFRVDITCKHFNFTAGKIIKELGYKPNQNIRDNIEKTVEAYFKYKEQVG